MAFFPVAPGHKIQPFVEPRGRNSLPPSPPPEMCLWSKRWSWGTEQWQQLHREIKSWSHVRKEKQNRGQTVNRGGGQTYPAKHTLKSHSLGGSFFQPPRPGRSMQSGTSYSQGASWKTLNCQELHCAAPLLCHHSTTLLFAAAWTSHE